MKKNKPLTVSVGLPTYEAGSSLVRTLNSIYEQSYFHVVKEVLVVVDGKSISDKIVKQIANKKLRIKISKSRKGQAARINDIVNTLKTDVVILTNDDVLLEKHAVEEMIKIFQDKNVDLISGNDKPLRSNKLLQIVIETGHKIGIKLSSTWKKGDNFLTCRGRLLGLSKRFANRLNIPEKIWNNDAFIYLFAKLNDFKFYYSPKSICYYQSPRNLREYVNQTLKFQNSFLENQKYFKEDISSFYQVPGNLKLRATLETFFRDPLTTTLYFCLFFYTRLLNKTKKNFMTKKGFWETDKSTKLLQVQEI